MTARELDGDMVHHLARHMDPLVLIEDGTDGPYLVPLTDIARTR